MESHFSRRAAKADFRRVKELVLNNFSPKSALMVQVDATNMKFDVFCKLVQDMNLLLDTTTKALAILSVNNSCTATYAMDSFCPESQEMLVKPVKLHRGDFVHYHCLFQ